MVIMGEFRVHHVRFFNYQPKTIHCLAYDKVSKKLAVSRSDGSVEIWLPEPYWLLEKVIPGCVDKSVEAIVWQGKRLFTAGLGGDVTEYDLQSLTQKHSEASNAGAIWCLTNNANGSRLAAGTEDGCVVLFDIEMNELRYLQSFGKQEGRILSIAWHTEEGVIVTGGIDNIRIWSVKSGQAMQRLTLGHKKNNQDTIVWCLAVTSDMTIISGDSRGTTCFWNGRHGTLLKSFSTHKADVLTLAVNEGGDCVVSCGVDPLMVSFELVTSKGNSKQWTQSFTQGLHKHDVHAVCFTEEGIVSAGVSTNLHFTTKVNGEVGTRRINHIPQNLVHVAKEKKFVLLQYSDYIEVWKLGHTYLTGEKDGEILALKTNPVKLLELKTKSQATILCSNISDDGNYLGYCDEHQLRLYNLLVDEVNYTPRVILSKLVVSLEDLRVPVHHLEFTSDGRFVVTATASGSVQVTEIQNNHTHSVHTFKDFESGIRGLKLSPDGEHFAVLTQDHATYVLNLKNYQINYSLPKYNHPPRTFRFSPKGENLVIAYSNNRIMEFDVLNREYTAWSQENSANFPRQWVKRHDKVAAISFNPRNTEHLILQDYKSFVIYDKSKKMPNSNQIIFTKQNMPSQDSAFHQCVKYNFLMCVEMLDDDWMLIVERTPLAIYNNLPPTLEQKKFGI